jgi:hypothetical protein
VHGSAIPPVNSIFLRAVLKVIIGDRETGWVVEKVEEKSITIKKGTKHKTFRR